LWKVWLRRNKKFNPGMLNF
jgi:hypothetical protein